MQVQKIRAQMQAGKSIFHIPLRVTFYARVSTDKDQQLNSLENQIQYYTQLINSKPNWTFVEGYIDEGISGISTKKRDSFNRMITHAKAGMFDLIITKEISRFSRSTLDSIKYTQQLLEYNVGVFFQNDNINTLDSDSEFRLVVMAGVAQDEVRKLSERLKFGFKQAVKNGHVLGNDKLWGYNKKDCILTINEEEAQVIRKIFNMYANEKMGVRRISQALYSMGHTSRKGNPFNVVTIRHILTNPKYKGWYCGNKTKSIDYRTKKQAMLEEQEWITYPDPSIPAIVPEELWNRANVLYKSRSKATTNSQTAQHNNRYPYSGKIICQEHSTSFHRQLLTTAKNSKEVWHCRIYRERGIAGCTAPQLRTIEINQIMAKIFSQLALNKTAIIHYIIKAIEATPQDQHLAQEIKLLESSITQLNAKKEKLLEISIEGGISTLEFKSRNDSLNSQLSALQPKLIALYQEQKSTLETTNLEKIKSTLQQALNFSSTIDPKLATTILQYIIVKKESNKNIIALEIHLKFNCIYEAVLQREKSSFCINSLKNITPTQKTKTI